MILLPPQHNEQLHFITTSWHEGVLWFTLYNREFEVLCHCNVHVNLEDWRPNLKHYSAFWTETAVINTHHFLKWVRKDLYTTFSCTHQHRSHAHSHNISTLWLLRAWPTAATRAQSNYSRARPRPCITNGYIVRADSGQPTELIMTKHSPTTCTHLQILAKIKSPTGLDGEWRQSKRSLTGCTRSPARQY